MRRRDIPGFLGGICLFPALLPGLAVVERRDENKAPRRVLRNLPELERVGLDRYRIYREQGRRLPSGLGRLLQHRPPDLEQQLRSRIREDLMRERVTRVGGWLVAETEADLAMVLVLAGHGLVQGENRV